MQKAETGDVSSSPLPIAARRSFRFTITVTFVEWIAPVLRYLKATEPRTYTALSKSHKVPRTTLWSRAHGRPSIEEKAKGQQYLTPSEEKALVEYLLRMSNNGFPLPIKYLRSCRSVVRAPIVRKEELVCQLIYEEKEAIYT